MLDTDIITTNNIFEWIFSNSFSFPQLSDFTELRAPTPEKAAFYFDAAVSSRTTSIPVVNEHGEVIEDPDERRNSNMIFTLHVYQYMIDKVGTGESEYILNIHTISYLGD